MSVESQNTTLWSASIFEGMNARIHKRQIDTLTFLALQARQPLRDLVCLRSLGLLGWKTNCRDWVNMTTGHGACMRDVIVVIQVHCQCVLMCGQILEHRNRLSSVDNTDVCLPGVLLFVVRQVGELGSHSRRFPLWACWSYVKRVQSFCTSLCDQAVRFGMHILSTWPYL
jgi:hypothetical protein